MMVRSHAALECFGIGGAVKEPRHDPQSGNLIPRIPSIPELIDLAPHASTASQQTAGDLANHGWNVD